jgi:Kef-type K+ transport system membrane component KefB
VTLTVGFVLLVSWSAGRVLADLHLPRLTGYLGAGVVAGPAVLDLIRAPAIEELHFASSAAVALIALTAGAELDLRARRSVLSTTIAISLVTGIGGAALLAGVTLLARSIFPFLHGLTLGETAAVAGLVGVTVIAQSPAVVVALKNELHARGPITQTLLGVVVFGDVGVVVLVALASTIARTVLGGPVDVAGTARAIAWELFGSFGLGMVLGTILSIYVQRVRGTENVFVLALALIVSELGPRLRLDPLLVMMSAGVVVANLGGGSRSLIDRIEAASMPVYVVFFTLAGASIHLDVLAGAIVPVLLLVSVRAAALLTGAQVGTRMVGGDPAIARWVGVGLLPQAGLAIALALLLARAFPTIGPAASALVLGVVAVNELAAPALLRWAWIRSGEGRAGNHEHAPSH